MVLPGVLGVMAGFGIATLAAVGLFIYFHHQTVPQQSYTQQQPNKRSSNRSNNQSDWQGYNPTDENTCSICLEAANSEGTPLMLRCGHVFHVTCIMKWRKFSSNICPNCRKTF